MNFPAVTWNIVAPSPALRWSVLLLILSTPLGSGCSTESKRPEGDRRTASPLVHQEDEKMNTSDWKAISDQQWREKLSPDEYHVLRQEGTEPAFRNRYHDCKEPGIYRCRGCGQELFSSQAKFDSGTGWPSFYEPLDPAKIETRKDRGLFQTRTEVHCNRCEGHLGHVFDDGQVWNTPTGKRYCLNSLALSLDTEAGGDATLESKQDTATPDDGDNDETVRDPA